MVLECVAGLCSITDYSVWWNMITQGDIMGAVLSSYTTTLDVYFYYLVLFMTMFMIYIKIQNFPNTILIGIIVGGAFIPFAATFSTFATVLGIVYFMIALMISIIFYRLFKG